jgi:sialic acid synthase
MDGGMTIAAQRFELIAEVGCNHQGSFEIARRFIDVATSFSGARHIKFQKRTVRELLTPEEYNRPHPVPENAHGTTYGAHREALEFSVDEHRELKAYCEAKGAAYGCSVWDMTSLNEVIAVQPAWLKIPSALNTHRDLLAHACRHFAGPIHISLGMTTRREEIDLVDLLRAEGRLPDVVLYACTSGYPIEGADACLLEITRLIQRYGKELRAVGYSGHHNGISLDIAAATLGARYIERHFTLNRTWRGTDHAASLEPDGLRRLNRNLAQLATGLTYKSQDVLPVEEPQRMKLKRWSGARAIDAGTA